MSLTQIQKLQMNKQVDRILHTPGNQPVGKQQLEMAFILDGSSNMDYLKSTIQDVVSALKSHDKIFQNVRSNVIFWRTQNIETQTMPMSFIQMGKPFVEWDSTCVDKSVNFDDLCAYLKMYHARSKCMILVTEGNYRIVDKECVKQSLNPFLKQKLLIITPEKMITGTSIFIEMIR